MSGFRPLIPQAVPLRATARGPLAVGRRVVGHPPLATRPWPSVRTEVVREFFLTEHGREPMDARELAGQIAKDSRPRAQTVAGYDLTFPPVKSVSTLWAVADLAGGCGDRTGPSGRGRGRFGVHRGSCLICTDTATKHPAGQRPGPGCRRVHPSRQPGGGPRSAHPCRGREQGADLDGRWLSVDGRVLFKANVAASEAYNNALEQHLRDTLGVWFVERPGTDPAERPIREILGIDPRLNQRWPTRRAHINIRRSDLAIQFQQDHGGPPTPVEALHLAQQATLETRDAKHEPRSLTEATRDVVERGGSSARAFRRRAAPRRRPSRHLGLHRVPEGGVAANLVQQSPRTVQSNPPPHRRRRHLPPIGPR